MALRRRGIPNIVSVLKSTRDVETNCGKGVQEYKLNQTWFKTSGPVKSSVESWRCWCPMSRSESRKLRRIRNRSYKNLWEFLIFFKYNPNQTHSLGTCFSRSDETIIYLLHRLFCQRQFLNSKIPFKFILILSYEKWQNLKFFNKFSKID